MNASQICRAESPHPLPSLLLAGPFLACPIGSAHTACTICLRAALQLSIPAQLSHVTDLQLHALRTFSQPPSCSAQRHLQTCTMPQHRAACTRVWGGQNPTKDGATQVAQVVKVAPAEQRAQGVSAHQHWQQSAQLDGDPRQKDELRRSTWSMADTSSLTNRLPTRRTACRPHPSFPSLARPLQPILPTP